MQVETIWSEYQSSLKGFLHKNVSNPIDVEDLLQEILIKTYQNLSKVQDDKKIKSWLFQIANNSIIDFYRKRGRSVQLTGDDLWYAWEGGDVYQQLSQCILPFIKGLPDDEAELLIAIELEGVSQKEYAAQQGVKYSTLKSRVKKSRQHLYGLFSHCCDFSINSRGELTEFTWRSKCSTCE